MDARFLLQTYQEIPVITRYYLTACVITTLLVQLGFITPFQLYFNPTLIVQQLQIWRLFTTFLFFGYFGFSFIFNVTFTYKYCSMLEEGSFRGRTADFFYMLLFGGVCMTVIALFVNLLFLGHAFTIMLVYIWSRRNPWARMNFFGLITFQAPFLPWVLLGFSFILGGEVLTDLMGISVGHIYYFLEDVAPNITGGYRFLKTPGFIKYLIEPATPSDERQDENRQERANEDINDPM